MSTPARVRKATHRDASAISELLAEAGLSPDALDASISSFFVAEAEGATVGTIGLEICGKTGLLRSAAVRADLRGGGIGGELVAALLLEARALSLREIVLLTTTASSYFHRLGFHTVERSSLQPEILASRQFREGCPSTAVCMRLRLPELKDESAP